MGIKHLKEHPFPGNKQSICGRNPRDVVSTRSEDSQAKLTSLYHVRERGDLSFLDRDYPHAVGMSSHTNLQSEETSTAVNWKVTKNEVAQKRRQRYLDKFRVPSRIERHLGATRVRASKGQAELQSMEMTDTESATTERVVAENIVFRDEALSQRITMGDMSSGDYDADADSAAGLGGYLNRPVRIAAINWEESTFTQTSINPWLLYFDNPQIKKKLDNYSRISCRLHLKFIINASPFYYGSLRACYFPLPDARSNYFSTADQLPFSQAPGVYLEPQNMSTAEMVLPFLWQANWLNATADDGFGLMGKLNFLQYANLRSANGVTGTGITVAVYAWAEDVRLMGPTTQAALQSDEYAEPNGVISGPATAVANVASRLTDVPVIGGFATATSMGAQAVAGIAKLFGYSNPPLIDDVKPVQNKTFHAFANVETRMPVDKLAIDPKNEVTISSKVAGVDEPDPLAFSEILTRESFLQGTLWANSQAVDSLLWSAMISPGYEVSAGGFRTSPPMSYFSRMFRFWRGSIIYKFRFIKTKYHKGRVLISWDPAGLITGTADTETTTFSRVVDLAVEDEVEVVIPYKSTYPWLNTAQGTGFMSNGATPTYTYTDLAFNGCITMRVQNVLTGPAASPEIDVLVYARAGEDFMFAVPSEISIASTVRDPAGVIQSEETDDISLQKAQPDQQIASITTGEIVCSLRPVLHRASLAYQQFAGDPSISVPAGIYSTANYLWRVPFGVGRMQTGYGRATIGGVGVTYNFAPNHPMDWVLNCFVGYRGSTNIHVNAVAIGENVKRIPQLSISRMFNNPIRNQLNVVTNTDQRVQQPVQGNQISRNSIFYPSGGTLTLVASGQTGMTLTNVQGQPSCSANIPQYLQNRFRLAFSPNRNFDYATETQFYDEVQVCCGFTASQDDGKDWPLLSYYYSAGVDFQPIFFICTPRLFDTNLPPARDP